MSANEVLEAEWLDDERPIPGRRLRQRIEKAMGPILAGLLIDAADLITFGPIGVVLGIFVGGGLAYYLGSVEKLPLWKRVLLSILSAIYCSIPFTSMLPAATLLGILIRYWKSEEED